MINNRETYLIPPSLNKTNQKVLFWLTGADIALVSVFLIIGLAISFPLFYSTNHWEYLIIFIVLTLLGLAFTYKPFGYISLWKMMIYGILYLFGKKQINGSLNVLNEKQSENLSRFNFKNGENAFVYKIAGVNISNFNEDSILTLEQKITELFNKAIDLQIYKIPVPFNTKEHFDKLNQLANVNKEIKNKYLNFLTQKDLNNFAIQQQFLVIKNLDDKKNELFEELKNIIDGFNASLETLNNYERAIVEKEIFNIGYKKTEIKYSYLQMDDEFISFIKFEALPNEVNENWLNTLLTIPNISFKINISNLETNKASKLINHGLASTKQQLSKTSTTKAVEAKQLENQIYALEELNEAFATKQEVINVFDIIFKIKASSKLELMKARKKLIRSLSAQRYHPVILYGRQFYSLETFNPLLETKIKERSFNVPASLLAFGHPFASGACIENDGVFVGIDNNNYPVFLNLTSTNDKKPNNNAVFVGTSGSGKTTATKIITALNLMLNNKVIIIDPDKQFEDLAKQFDGQIIDVAKPEEFSINPFHFFPEETVEEKIQRIRKFFDIIFEKLNPLQIDRLTNILYHYYKENYRSLKENQLTFSQFYKLVENDNKVDEETKDKVYQYTTGQQNGFIWDKPNNFHFDKNLIIFNIRGMNKESELFKAQIYLILDYIEFIILNNMGNAQNISLVIDEAHTFLSPQTMSALYKLQDFAKRVRKYGSSLIIATQNLKDFNKESLRDEAKAIINNSSTLIVMKLQNDDINDLADLLSGDLTNAEAEILKTASRGKALVLRGDERFSMKFDTVVL